jgi:chromosome segregation ATPase
VTLSLLSSLFSSPTKNGYFSPLNESDHLSSSPPNLFNHQPETDNSLTDYIEKNEMLLKRIRELEIEKNALKKEISEQSEEIIKSTHSLDLAFNSQSEMESLRVNLEAEKKELKKNQQDLEEIQLKTEQKHRDAQSIINIANDQTKRIGQLNDQLKEVNTKLDVLDLTRKRLKQINKKLEAESKELQDKFNLLDQECSSLTEQLNKRDREHQLLKTNIDSLREKNEKIEKINATLTTSCQKLSYNYERLEIAKRILRESVDISQAELALRVHYETLDKKQLYPLLILALTAGSLVLQKNYKVLPTMLKMGSVAAAVITPYYLYRKYKSRQIEESIHQYLQKNPAAPLKEATDHALHLDKK